MGHVSRKLGQFAYFDIQLDHPEWKGKYVLDFGGNSGNILLTPEPVIDEPKYWCVDVSEDGLAAGRARFPHAHFVHYDRYNINFNPGGSRSAEIPPLGRQFDYILAYSVFTHVDVPEMDELIGKLMSMLSPSGALAFTFIDPFFRSWPDENPVMNLEWRLDRMGPGAPRAVLVEEAGRFPWFRLAGEGDVYPGSAPILKPERYEGKPCHVFHTAEFVRQHFPQAEIRTPASDEMQHCCILRRDPAG
jgi:hypothetical protein